MTIATRRARIRARNRLDAVLPLLAVAVAVLTALCIVRFAGALPPL